MTTYNEHGWPDEWPERNPMPLGKFNHFSNQVFETLYADRGVHFEPTLEEIDQVCVLAWDLVKEKEKAKVSEVEAMLRRAAAGYIRDDGQWLRAERAITGVRVVVNAAENLLKYLKNGTQVGLDEAEEKLRKEIADYRETEDATWDRPEISLPEAMKSVIAYFEEQELKKQEVKGT